MPKVASNISHAALHHHRIGIHPDYDDTAPRSGKTENADSASDSNASQQDIASVIPDESIDDAKRIRRHAIALYRYVLDGDGEADVRGALESAMTELIESSQSETTDAETRVVLADTSRLAGNLKLAFQLVSPVYRSLKPGARFANVARSIMAGHAFSGGDIDETIQHYRVLTQNRFIATDHYNLAISHLQLGHRDTCIASLERALRIDPDLIPAHRLLAELLAETDLERSELHGRAAQAIEELGLQ